MLENPLIFSREKTQNRDSLIKKLFTFVQSKCIVPIIHSEKTFFMPRIVVVGLVVWVIFLAYPTFAQVPGNSLSSQATVALITVAPGEESYSVFGHTALWIQDPLQSINKVYNYGTFDFNAPYFIIKFTRGKLLYMLSIGSIENMVYGAQYENRSVFAQELNLSSQQKNNLYTFLEKTYQSEDRYYKYDFFYDNCTTRVRDALQKVCGDSLKFGTKNETLTFRQWIDRYLQKAHYLDLGIDLGVASPADKPASTYESMFLPDNLMRLTSQATIVHNGKKEPLESKATLLFLQHPSTNDQSFSLPPKTLFWILFGVGLLITLLQYRGTGRQFWLDAIFFSVIGILGWVLLLLWIATDHQATIKNWHLLWAVPFHFPIAIWLLRKSKPNWLRIYFWTYLLLLFVLLISWNWLPQELDSELIPLVLLLAVRSAFLIFRTRPKIKIEL